MTRGRRPKSVELKVIEGTYRQDRDRAPPQRPDSQERRDRPTCPRWMSKEARQEWRRVLPRLEEAGMLSRLEHATIEAHCTLYAAWQALEREVVAVEQEIAAAQAKPEKQEERKQADLFGGSPRGERAAAKRLAALHEHRARLQRSLRQTIRELRACDAELGITPASRSRVPRSKRSAANPFAGHGKRPDGGGQ